MQRYVNETPAMTGFNTQNLFKMPDEKRYRVQLLKQRAHIQKVGEGAEAAKEQKEQPKSQFKPALELLQESDTEISECEAIPEEEIIEETKQKFLLKVKEQEWVTQEEFKEIQAEKQKVAEK